MRPASRSIVFLLALAGCSTVMTPRSTSPEAIVAYVDRAAGLVARSGVGACTDLQSSRWFAGEWYVFVLADDGQTLCHPARPEMVGRAAADLVDVNGKRFGEDFIRVARAGGGWVDYMWPRPSDAAPESKRSYVRTVTAADGKVFIVGSGGYSSGGQ